MPKKSGRNASGSGTIRKRTDGRWEGRYTIGVDPLTGKQKQKSVYARTKREVSEKLRKITVEIDDGSYIETKRMKCGDWLDIFIQEYTVNLKPYTRRSYERIIENHIRPSFERKQLCDITPVMIQRFINNLINQKTGEPLSPKTVKNVHGVLHTVLDQARQNGYLARNPASLTRLPRRQKSEIHPIMDENVRRFLDTIRGHQFEFVYLTDLFTGMRLSEIIGLEWEDIDFKNHVIHIHRQLQPIKGSGGDYQFVTPKSNNDRIIVPADYVFEVLSLQKARQAEWKAAAGTLWENEYNLVFTNEFGGHLCHVTVYRNLKRILNILEMPDTRFHDLRHSFAVISLQSGDDPKTVQENLGHYSAAFTLDVYGHVTNQMRRASADRMNQFIDSVLKD